LNFGEKGKTKNQDHTLILGIWGWITHNQGSINTCRASLSAIKHPFGDGFVEERSERFL
jgi:hypothetical protein